jgi:hypothetical protein
MFKYLKLIEKQYSLNLSKDFCRPSALSDRSKMSSANLRQFKDSVSNVTG